MIAIQNLHFAYKRKAVFTGINTTFEPGHIYGILGRNGTGKSTLLYNIAGLLYPQKGTVKVAGHTAGRRQPDFLRDIFMVPEEFYLPDIPIQKFVEYYAPFYPRFDKQSFLRYIREFDVPETGTLLAMSYGQKKKVLISFGVASNTSVLLMDEPTNGLDIISKGQLRKVIAGAIDDQKCFLISSHQVKDLENLIDELMIIGETQIILKQSLLNVGARLSFQVSFDARDLEEALYYEPLLRGHTIVSRNAHGEESKIDLELLYKATMNDPVKMQSILDH